MLSEQTAASGSSSSSSRGGAGEGEEIVITGREIVVRSGGGEEEVVVEEEPEFRDIHALSPPATPTPSYHRRRRESWESTAAGGSRHTSIRSVGSDTAPSELFPTMSREFSAMVAAAASANAAAAAAGDSSRAGMDESLGRIGEEELEETNPLAIVPDSNPIPSPRRAAAQAQLALPAPGDVAGGGPGDEVSVGQVKKEEVESKIAAWQIAEVAKVNNRFKREEVVINGWEGDQVEKANAWLKKYERKLEEKRAKAMEKAQNEVAKARRKAEEKRASAEAKRGTKVARVLELANFMRAVGRAPSKRSFF
uniref:Remorin C-terminal domain-containing protein n=1 Tax=Leersia perrieri TaxID=77586 RepID=A0A0D9X0I5_9ORYZ